MQILIVGAGATGGFFGAKLAAAGRDVTFLVRAGRAATLGERGLRVIGPDGTGLVRVQPTVVTAAQLATAGDPAGPGGYPDIVLFTVKAAGLDEAIDDVRPAVGPATTVVPVLNGLRHLDALNAAFGAARVLGGVALVAAHLDGRGDVVLYSDASLTIGAQNGPPTPAVDRAGELLGGAGFEVTVSDRIIAAMWAKWAFIAAAGAVTCLLGGTVGEIVAAGGTEVTRAVIAETHAVAAAAGYPVAADHMGRTYAWLTEPGSPFAPSMYRDLRQGRPVEAGPVFADLVDRGRALGVHTPLLAAAVIALRIHNDRVTRSSAPGRPAGQRE